MAKNSGLIRMGKLGEQVRRRGQPHIITPRLEEWLVQHDSVVLDNAQADVLKQLVMTKPRDRSASFSSSSRGKCPRFQVFQYLGMPVTLKIDPILANLFNDGTWRHLRWQMTLMAADIVTDVEAPWTLPERRVRGSLDARNDEEAWGLELKGINSYGFGAVITNGVRPDHELQVGTYFVGNPELERFVVLYECKNTNQWSEIIVSRDPIIIAAVEHEIDYLNECVDNQELPPVLPECANGDSTTFKKCPYSGDCRNVDYDEAAAYSEVKRRQYDKAGKKRRIVRKPDAPQPNRRRLRIVR